MRLSKRTIMILGLAGSLVVAVAALDLDSTKAQSSDLGELNQQIEAKKKQVEELQAKVQTLQGSLKARRAQAASLENQLGILSQQIERLEIENQITQNQIEQTQLEIAQNQADIALTEQEIIIQQGRLAGMISSLNRLDQKSSIEILLTNTSLSDFFNQLEATIKLHEGLKGVIDGLQLKKDNLQRKVKTLEERQSTLEAYTQKLEDDQARLGEQSSARAKILAETRNSESRFQELLQQAKQEQITINADIQALEKVIRDKLTSQGQAALAQLGRGQIIYPVPFLGITAFFHDPDYPFRYIFEHPAVDLRTPQATPVKAALPGFVARVREAGLGYSYVMLIHADGLSTVYGHVSRIFVKEDEFVNQGDIIALSGGLPGTPGAGRLTTGAHLHFEVRLNGIPVDPLNYLPSL